MKYIEPIINFIFNILLYIIYFIYLPFGIIQKYFNEIRDKEIAEKKREKILFDTYILTRLLDNGKISYDDYKTELSKIVKNSLEEVMGI